MAHSTDNSNTPEPDPHTGRSATRRLLDTERACERTTELGAGRAFAAAEHALAAAGLRFSVVEVAPPGPTPVSHLATAA